jgi:hypothetical protein
MSRFELFKTSVEVSALTSTLDGPNKQPVGEKPRNVLDFDDTLKCEIFEIGAYGQVVMGWLHIQRKAILVRPEVMRG